MTSSTPAWIRRLEELNACEEALDYARTCSSWEECWQKCVYADWLIWVPAHTAVPGSPEHKQVVRAAVACAETPLRFIKNPGVLVASRSLLDVVLRWTDGLATLEEIAIERRDAIDWATSAAASAAYSTAAGNLDYAARAAAAAVAAVAAYADARLRALREMADLVRTFYPTAPDLGVAS